MLNRILFLVVTLLGALSAMGQTTVSGNVFDYQNKTVPLEKVSVRNLNNKAYVLTNEAGKFTIAANLGDLLEFSTIGYHTDTLYLTDLKQKYIFMPSRAIDIAGVEIQSTKLSPFLQLKDPNAKEYRQLSTDGLRNKDNDDRAGGLIFALGHSKMRREKLKLAALSERERLEEEISKNFTEKKVADLLKLTGQELKDFMDLFRPTWSQVKETRPYNYDYHLVQSYHAWLKMAPAQRKLPPLPKIQANP